MSKHQCSVSDLPDAKQEAVMHQTEVASEQYPSVLIEGVRVHVCEMDGDWEVWLNCEDMDFTGLCVSVGTTRDDALAQAVKSLEAVVEHLQSPPK